MTATDDFNFNPRIEEDECSFCDTTFEKVVVMDSWKSGNLAVCFTCLERLNKTVG